MNIVKVITEEDRPLSFNIVIVPESVEFEEFRRPVSYVLIMPRPEAIIFDLDETLIQTAHILEQSFIAAFAEHAIELGSNQFKNWIGKEKQSFDDLYPKCDSIAGLSEAIDRHYLDSISKQGVEWLDGVLEEIQKLHGQFPLAIFTNAPRSYVQAASYHLPLTSFFKCIVALDDVAPNGKPRPDGILLCCRLLSVSPEKCVYVGDHVLDMMTARAAGSIGVLIPSKITTPSAHRYADYALGHLQGLSSIFSDSSNVSHTQSRS